MPSVDKILSDKRIHCLEEVYSHDFVLQGVRQYLEGVRRHIAKGVPLPSFDQMVETICTLVNSLAQPTLRPVINATGVILHTNLGRAPLSREAIVAMEECSRGYTNLEIDLDSGKRGSRQVHVQSLLCKLTGAEAALVVNNNASAVLLALSTLVKGKEVIVSRGQAVEIGGGFRIPSVMRQSGAKLVEVGTTNRTYLSDYEEAITHRTAALLRVHSSNFRIVGFTQSVAIEELTQLGERYELLVLDDLGSGCLLDTGRFGLDPEPMVQQSIAAGAGLAMFSADKLLGGPQAGIIVGQGSLIAKMQRHPLARAVRIDKVRLAGLAVTLLHYLKGEAETKIPVWRMISASVGEIEERAQRWCDILYGAASVVEGESVVGGGSLPGGTIPTRLVAIKGRGRVKDLADKLRSELPVVIGRTENNLLLLDPRTVLPEEEDALLSRLRNILNN
ncbi:MAG: L-seryl-tRNA(Sec) selenium transferase [Dehalococcoidia bacterium]|nr:L-seryl-tRNA(Sec) selenium transferase [Dehalococcoidia bacterium]